MESPTHETLTALFAGAVARHGDRRAVSDDYTVLSYAELDRASDAFAATLRGLRIGPGDRVGVYLERGVEAVASILGILKAGACYVAVDERYPDARRDHMLVNGGCKLAVTSSATASLLKHLDMPVIVYSGESPEGAVDEPTADAADVLPQSAASILFTSGSSGEPKAIVLEHRNLAFFATSPSLAPLRPQDRTGQISSLSFDAFHYELWVTLVHGAELVVLPPVVELLGADFRGELEYRGVTVMLVPTMVLNQVVREDPDAFAPLRVLQAGGDVLAPAACRTVLEGAFAGQLYNLYGPSEITTACTAHRVTAQDAAQDSIPIGRPLAGVTVRVLTDGLRPAAVGEAGEIYVGGPGVARGYLDRPDLTSERFVPDPLPGGSGTLYRTGDVARTREDGVLMFLGRRDGQVKIRGYRVEPGEIERVLVRDPAVLDAVVLPWGEREDRHLVAFVVLGEPADPAWLPAYAAAELPAFMVPSRFVRVDVIPSNEHGKRDVAALREKLTEQQRRRDSAVPPATETERYLADLWAQLLGTEPVGRDDDFFLLGGHSLLAFGMFSRIRQERAADIEFADVMRNPVLRDIAAVIDDAVMDGAGR